MKRNILFLSHDNDLNGAERSLIVLLTHIDRAEFSPIVLTPSKGPMDKILKDCGIPHRTTHLDRWIPSRGTPAYPHAYSYLRNLRSRLWSLLTLIEREQIDCVYTNTSTLIDGAFAAKRAGIPHVWHIREYLDGNSDLKALLPHSWIDRITLRLSDMVITPSHALAQQRFSTSRKVCVVPNGVDPSSFSKGDGERIRSELDIPFDSPIITYIGSILPRKDPLTFIHSAAAIYRNHPESHFLLVGPAPDTPLERQAKSLVAEYGIDSNFHFLGFRADTSDILAATSIHISTSLQETFGRTLIEAMAAKKPVIATRCGGPEEIILSGETGTVVMPGDVDAIASAALYLLENPNVIASYGSAGLQRVREKFTAQSYAHGVESVLHRVIDQSSRYGH